MSSVIRCLVPLTDSLKCLIFPNTITQIMPRSVYNFKGKVTLLVRSNPHVECDSPRPRCWSHYGRIHR